MQGTMDKKKNISGINRRQFIQSTAAAGAGLIFSPMIVAQAAETAAKSDEIRWQVLKAMLDEFPSLKIKTQEYLNKRTKERFQSRLIREQKRFLG